MLSACGIRSPADAPDPPARADDAAEVPAPTASPVPFRAPQVITGDGASVALAFTGVGTLHQGYFSTEAWVGALAQDLGACFAGLAEVVVSYDNETRIGRILIHTGLSDLACAPLPGADGVDLSPMVPITSALARYRDAVAAATDMRVGNFRVGVRLVQGGEICDLVADGQFPSDGTTFSPCLSLRGHEVCLGDRHDGVTTLPWPAGDQRSMLARCVGE